MFESNITLYPYVFVVHSKVQCGVLFAVHSKLRCGVLADAVLDWTVCGHNLYHHRGTGGEFPGALRHAIRRGDLRHPHFHHFHLRSGPKTCTCKSYCDCCFMAFKKRLLMDGQMMDGQKHFFQFSVSV